MINFFKKNPGVILIVVVAVISRFVVALLPPVKFLYSPDERIMSDSTLLLFTNSTPTCLEWPATTLMIPLFIISFINMLIHTNFISSIMHFDMLKISDAITTHLYYSFNNVRLIQYGRILIAIVGLASYFFIFHFLRFEKKEFRLFFVFSYTISAALINQSWVLHPDSIAVVFWVLFILYYVFRFDFANNKSLIILAALFSLLAASKFTYVIFLPLLLLSFLVFNFKKHGWIFSLKQTTLFLFITGIFMMALFPFLWTDSITFAKSFFGNIFLKSSGEGNSLNTLLFYYLPSLITYPGLILAFTGLVLSFNRIGNMKTIFLILTFLLFAYPIANASQTYERYSLALLPMLLVWAAFGFNYLIEKIKNPIFLKAVISLVIVFCSLQSLSSVRENFDSYHRQTNFILCRTWLLENLQKDEKIALPVTFEGFLYENRNCLGRIIARNSDSLLITAKLQTQILPEYKNKPLNIRAIILEDLFMDEKNYQDQKTKVKFDFVSSHAIDHKVFDIYYYTESNFSSLHCFKYNEVLNDTMVKYILTQNKEDSNLQLVKKFDEIEDTPFYLYLK
ncbi:MAG: hypothetical protein ABIT08_01265 [Bacteroidia bacterium]